jgi:hypothetical protein
LEFEGGRLMLTPATFNYIQDGENVQEYVDLDDALSRVEFEEQLEWESSLLPDIEEEL